MSRIGRKPIAVPDDVKMNVRGQSVSVTGPKGELTWTYSDPITVQVDGSSVVVQRADDSKKSRQLHGLTRALIANMIKGVREGYEKRLLIYGTGYSCNLKGGNLELNVGFMGRSVNKGPQFVIPVPDGVEAVVETPMARGESEPAKLLIRGIDKQKVGQFAAEIRALRKPEPYKGKGVRYENEQVRRKQGKSLVGAGG